MPNWSSRSILCFSTVRILIRWKDTDEIAPTWPEGREITEPESSCGPESMMAATSRCARWGHVLLLSDVALNEQPFYSCCSCSCSPSLAFFSFSSSSLSLSLSLFACLSVFVETRRGRYKVDRQEKHYRFPREQWVDTNRFIECVSTKASFKFFPSLVFLVIPN